MDVFLRGEDRLPYAGAGAAAYPDWPGLVPGLEVIGTRLPGRESRLSEPPIASVAEMARTLVAKFATLPAKPVALYGHSLGGLIAFETALALQRQGRPPVADREPGAGKSHASLSMPLVVLAGRDDASVSSKEVWAWREHSSGDLSFHLIPGGHFFVHQESTGWAG